MQWETEKVEVAVQLEHRRPPLLGVLVGLFCLISGRKKSKTRLSLARLSQSGLC